MGPAAACVGEMMAAGPRFNFDRTVILGNSGSGKSWLAQRLARRLVLPAIALDSIQWEAGKRAGAARDPAAAAAMVRRAATGSRWVIEGALGWLAQAALPRATMLIWLDVDVDTCVANLGKRTKPKSRERRAKLAAWVREYPRRRDSSSYAGHARIAARFSGDKIVLRSRAEIDDFLARSEASRRHRH